MVKCPWRKSCNSKCVEHWPVWTLIVLIIDFKSFHHIWDAILSSPGRFMVVSHV